MDPAEYKKYVCEHAVWFRGHHLEKWETIAQAERRLGIVFPESMKWLLMQYGYWRATGVAGLPYVVGATLANRHHFPKNWIVLGQPDSHFDETSGKIAVNEPGARNRPRLQTETVILVLFNECRWDGKAVFHCDCHGEIINRYPGFTEYTIARQRHLAKTAVGEYHHCLPSFHVSRGEPLLGGDNFFNSEELQQRLLETVVYQNIQTDAPGKLEDTSKDAEWRGRDSRSEMKKTSTATFAEHVAAIIEDRRSYLSQHKELIPRVFLSSSSSPRQSLHIESPQFEGHLLIAEVRDEVSHSREVGLQNGDYFLFSELDCLGIAREQIVSLIREVGAQNERDWLVCWVPDSRLSETIAQLRACSCFSNGCFVPASEAQNIVSRLSRVA